MKKKISCTKLIVLFLFINCTLVELFTGWVVIQNLALAATMGIPLDLTPLTTLVGTVVAEVFGFAVYAAKSTKENTKGGIVYDSTFCNMANGIDNDLIEEEQIEEDITVKTYAVG